MCIFLSTFTNITKGMMRVEFGTFYFHSVSPLTGYPCAFFKSTHRIRHVAVPYSHWPLNFDGHSVDVHFLYSAPRFLCSIISRTDEVDMLNKFLSTNNVLCSIENNKMYCSLYFSPVF